MFTPKANSKQKRVKSKKKCIYRSFDSTLGRAYNMHGRAAHCWATRMVRVCRAHSRARLTAQIFWFFRFHCFAHKIHTVNPFSMSFSPTRSWHLALSYSTEKFKFQLSQNSFQEPHIITYFQKRLTVDFPHKISFSRKRLD